MSVIKLRGLPWSCTQDDIVKFLEGVKIVKHFKKEPYQDVETEKNAIYMMTYADGRPNGEAFIQVEDEGDVEVAVKKDNALMGQRYIEGKIIDT